MPTNMTMTTVISKIPALVAAFATTALLILIVI